MPIAAFAVLVTYFLVHVEEPESEDRRIDYAGITVLSLGLVSLLVALDQVDDWGWGDPKVVAMLALAAILIVAFVRIERRAGMNALVPRAVMSNESFRASCVAITLMSATFFAALLYLPQFMQKHLGYSPLEAGVGVLPFLATFALVSFIAGPLYNRLGAKPLAAVGAACIAIAPFLFSQVTESSGYAALVPGMFVLGIGIGSFYPTATTAGVTSVDESQSSLAGGILYMCQIAGGAIGLGLTTTIFRPVVRRHPGLPPRRGALLVGFLIALFFVGGRLIDRHIPGGDRLSGHCTGVLRSTPAADRTRSSAEDVVAGPLISTSSPGLRKTCRRASRAAVVALTPTSLSGPRRQAGRRPAPPMVTGTVMFLATRPGRRRPDFEAPIEGAAQTSCSVDVGSEPPTSSWTSESITFPPVRAGQILIGSLHRRPRAGPCRSIFGASGAGRQQRQKGERDE